MPKEPAEKVISYDAGNRVFEVIEKPSKNGQNFHVRARSRENGKILWSTEKYKNMSYAIDVAVAEYEIYLQHLEYWFKGRGSIAYAREGYDSSDLDKNAVILVRYVNIKEGEGKFRVAIHSRIRDKLLWLSPLMNEEDAKRLAVLKMKKHVGAKYKKPNFIKKLLYKYRG